VNTAPNSFEAHAFNPDLGSEVATGQITFDSWNLHFHSEEAALRIPLPRLKVELGEGEDERVYFSDPSQPGWKIYTLDQSVLGHRALANESSVREQLSNIVTKREVSKRLKVTLWCVAGFAVLAWVGWIASGLMARSLVANIPPEWEAEIGGEALKEMQAEMVFVEDPNRVAQLAALAAPLTRRVGGTNTQFTFHIVEDDEPNAYALPGGHIIVYTGMLDLVDRPEELLGVIAHEVAHVTQKHGFRKALSAAGPFLIFGVFLRGGNGVLNVLGENSGFLIQQSFSQEYETEADNVGWQYLVDANIDPRGMMDLFLKLKGYELSQKFARVTPQAFDSHPALNKRIARLEAKWKKLPRKTGFIELKAIGPAKP
jgi:Zn-dependent protease with chaperone function